MLLRKTDLFSRPARSEWLGETVFKAERNKTLQLAEQVGCLTNRFIGNKQQYFLRRALPMTVHRGAKRNHSSAESFFGGEFIQMFRNICYCNAICAIRVRVHIPSMKPPRQCRSMRRKLLLKDGAVAVHCKM